MKITLAGLELDTSASSIASRELVVEASEEASEVQLQDGRQVAIC